MILFCTLAGTVFANSQITGRLYLREQREYLRKISARLEEELRSGTAPKDAVRRIEQEEKILIAYSAETGDPEILAGELRSIFQQKGMGFQKFWMWDQDYSAAVENGSRFRLYRQEKMNYSILAQYLSLDSGLYAIAAIVPDAQEFIEIVNHIGFAINLVSVMTSMALLIILTRHITNPLEKIRAFTKQVSSRDYNPLQIQTGDELEDVADSLNEMARGIEQYQRLLEEKNEQMKQLLSDVAHDLKTPVTLVGMYASGIKDGLDDGTFLDTILYQNERISQIVEKLLHLSQIGQNDYPCEEVEPGRILRDCMKEQEILFARRNLTLSENIEPDTRIRANPELLGELFSNLLSNAAKYALPGPVNMELRCEEERCVFAVSNKTENVDLDTDRIWQPFYVGEDSRNKELSGTGLGLSIVKRIAERFGYTVSCGIKGDEIRFEAVFPMEGRQ